MSDDRLSPEQQALARRVTPRVAEIARAVRAQVGTLALEDFESAGYEALVRAALRYDPSTGVPFQGYAYLRIRGAMIDAVRAANPAVRRHKRALRALAATQALYEEETRRAPKGADPRSLKERVEAAAALIQQTTSAVLLSRMAPEDPESARDEAAEPADELLINAELRHHLGRALARCEDDERAMIDALYHRNINMHAYAAELGVSVSTISRRHGRLLRKLGGLMPGTGPP